MVRGMKKAASDRSGMLRSSASARSGMSAPPEYENRKEVVYAQNSLQSIDNAPEPSTSSSIDRHAVSAADLMSHSMSAVDNRGPRSEFKNAARSQSFTLHGSGGSLLLKGGISQARRNTAASTTSSNASPRSEGVKKRSIYAPKDLDIPVKGEKDSRADSRAEESEISTQATDPPANNELNEISSESTDSYDADILGTGIDPSELEKSFRLAQLTKQTSSLSAKQGYMGSIADYSNESDDDYDDEDDFPGSVSTFEEEPFTFCGFHAPRLKLPVNRIASAIVRYAPCFWCFPIPISATDRTVLTRLNIMSAFLTIGQIVSTAWLIIIMLLPSETAPDSPQNDGYSLTRGLAPNLWSLHGSMYACGFFAGVIFVTNLVTLKVIQVVNLVGAIRYLWVLLYLIPFQIFFVLSLTDFYNVTDVWIKHWWRMPTMAWLREVYCAPGTAGAQCMVPIYRNVPMFNDTFDETAWCLKYFESTNCTHVGPQDEVNSETEWCLKYYETTNCTDIRNAAQDEVRDLMTWFYNTNVAWGFMLTTVLLLVVNTLERIISRPMVQKSRESNVPAWLSLPFFGCSVAGAVFRYSPSSVLSVRGDSEIATNDYAWIGTAYIACGVLFMFSAALGWFISTFSILSGRDKRTKSLCVSLFIFLMGVTSFILTVIFVASVAYSVALVDVSIKDFGERGDIACGVDTANSCSNCDRKVGPLKCPEWTMEDVTHVLQTQTKGSATLAVIFFIYSFSALRFGFVLRRHVTMYQIEYV